MSTPTRSANPTQREHHAPDTPHTHLRERGDSPTREYHATENPSSDIRENYINNNNREENQPQREQHTPENAHITIRNHGDSPTRESHTTEHLSSDIRAENPHSNHRENNAPNNRRKSPRVNSPTLRNRRRANPRHATPTPTPTPQNTRNEIPSREIHRPTQPKKKGMRKRANIKIATLNMNGLHVSAENRNGFEKWSEINATMKRENIAILALQETHLDDALTSSIKEIFQKRLQIYNSKSEQAPRTSAGVAFVINKDLINLHRIETRTLIPGCALSLKIKWHENEETKLINVYAPNNRTEHRPFWQKLEAQRTRHNIPRPDFLLGDFNLTEDAIDRAPPKLDNSNATEALRNLRQDLEVIDQWRHEHPGTREYTYRTTHNNAQIKSRLDRIYITKQKTNLTFDWYIGPSTVPMDHWMVSVRFAPKTATVIGSGRWTWPLNALHNKKLMNKTQKLGKALEHKLEHLDPASRQNENAQTLWAQFKNNITIQAKAETSAVHFRRASKIRNLNKDREHILQDEHFEDNPKLQWEEALLADRLAHLERLNSSNQRAKAATKISTQGERLSAAWANVAKAKKPKININRLRSLDTTEQRFVTNTKKMAELAKEYHESIQTKDLHPFKDDHEKANAELQILQNIPPQQRLSNPELSHLQSGITQKDVETALKNAKNGTATGLDGCPHELWKTLNKKFENAKKH
jgi:exonuclease III